MTQVVSCGTYTAADYIPSVVNNDKYLELSGSTGGLALLLLIYNMMVGGKFKAGLGDQPAEANDSTTKAVAPTTEDGTGPATGTNSDGETTANTNGSATARATTDTGTNDELAAQDDDWNSGGDDWTSG